MTIENKEQTNETIETQTIAAMDAETNNSELSTEEAENTAGGCPPARA